jgi:hypothetical protein
MVDALGDAQIPFLAFVLVCGSLTKIGRVAVVRAGLGPTSLFPIRHRRRVGLALCCLEFGLGASLVVTAVWPADDAKPAQFVRLGACLLFVVATCTLIELRNARPDVGCGCFGEFSSTPVTSRTLVRSAALAAAALGSMYVPQATLKELQDRAASIAVFWVAELIALALLSPEVREVLVRIGYTAPCELREMGAEQTLGALTRSRQWRNYSGLILGQRPTDTWRELCWRYFTFPSSYGGREAEVVFAVDLQHRRPAVLSALVDTATGTALPWPDRAPRRIGLRRTRAASGPGLALPPEAADSRA